MATYNIKKSYDSKPSKNKTEEMGLSLEKAQFELDIIESLWRKNGGSVIERSEFELICEESDGSETITWTIEEIED
jgi:hypothetical protein